jgi:hypothetical protein
VQIIHTFPKDFANPLCEPDATGRHPEAPRRRKNSFLHKLPSLFEAFKGLKSEFLKAGCSESVFKNVFLAAARSSFLKTCDAESELEGEDDERAILELAFLMQFRNKVRPAQFFCISLGECRAKSKSQKSAP